MSSKYLDNKTVDSLAALLREQDIPVARAAGAMGVSRPHLSQMLNKHLPMSRIYGLAIRQYVMDVKTQRNMLADPT